MGSLHFGDFQLMRGFPEEVVHGGVAAQTALVFEREKPGKSGLTVEPRAAMALKSHSEAERRRRERINAHLSTLRTLIPGTGKMDKAALLTEVISRIKELKTSTTEISQGVNVPADADEVKVEVEASLCCADRPELLMDLKQTLLALRLRTVKAEISTVGGRVKNDIVLTCEGGGAAAATGEYDTECNIFTNNVHQALKSVLERASSQPDFSAGSPLSGKRRRLSPPSFPAASSSP
ncbi:unnamed protein product [Spirodela intermedia]|uniref:BHLH domain-containing protein n=1 Tax=Spirodela intermedia TaxID=51605 RepID=A0A7I8JN37_SPIIN|nr:unnamed protein product [Spirodela intermedia]CAA6671549.1 unnamed protein product [Spirodela intermedia]